MSPQNRFAEFAESLESALGLGGEKTALFIETLSKQMGPTLNRWEKQIFKPKGGLNLRSLREELGKAYGQLLRDMPWSLEEIVPLMARSKDILGELVRPEELLPHLLTFGQKYFFNSKWDSPIDEFGMDPEVVESIRPLFEFLYNEYWRVQVEGIENIPAKGAGLLVGNHSGALPYDGAMIDVAVIKKHRKHRTVRFLVEDFVYHFPFLGTFIHRIGGVRACPENATWLLNKGELVVVFPEGVKGLGKLYRDRYQLQRFGRGGFIRLALRTGAPIIPTAVIGAEEIHPIIWKSSILAKSMQVPYLPVTPTFPWLGPVGMIPFPTRWKIIFGKPIVFDKYKLKDADDNLLVHKLAEEVRQTIQKMINGALKKRRSVWFG